MATLSWGFFCVQIQNLLYAFDLISSIEVAHFLGDWDFCRLSGWVPGLLLQRQLRSYTEELVWKSSDELLLTSFCTMDNRETWDGQCSSNGSHSSKVRKTLCLLLNYLLFMHALFLLSCWWWWLDPLAGIPICCQHGPLMWLNAHTLSPRGSSSLHWSHSGRESLLLQSLRLLPRTWELQQMAYAVSQ
jgi:hypothetical protein